MENKIYLGLNAEKVDEKLAKQFEGVGLIRSEYLCRNINEYVTTKKCQEYIESYLTDVCKYFKEKEVWYRFTDLTPNEISILEGADSIETEKWHFIGTKGVRRHLKYPEAFKIECEIIKKVHEKHNNLGVIIPYIKDIDEYINAQKIIREAGYKGRIGIMAEIPSTAIDLESYINKGASHVVIGLNDLTSLMLGTYRESEYHNKLHPIIIRTIKNIQEVCKTNNISYSIAGYLSNREIEYFKQMNLGDITINYANLPEIDSKYANLEDIKLLEKIKKSTKERRYLMENRKETK